MKTNLKGCFLSFVVIPMEWLVKGDPVVDGKGIGKNFGRKRVEIGTTHKLEFWLKDIT